MHDATDNPGGEGINALVEKLIIGQQASCLKKLISITNHGHKDCRKIDDFITPLTAALRQIN